MVQHFNENKLTDLIEITSNFAAILTAIIAVVFYYRSLKKNYYLNDIPGNYKIFSGLRDDESATVLTQIKINYVSQKGWFFGYLEYTEPFKNKYSRSEGNASVFGKIDYSYWRLLFGKLLLVLNFKKYNPLEVNDISSFHGTIYFLNRNDRDVSISNWKDDIIQQYSIIHYKDSHRFKLYNPQFDSYLQLPNELVLINIDKVPDQMFNLKQG